MTNKKSFIFILQKVIASRETVKVLSCIKKDDKLENVILGSSKVSLTLKNQVRGKFKKGEVLQIQLIRDVPDPPKSKGL